MKHHRKKQQRILTDCGRGIWYRINLKSDHELLAIFNRSDYNWCNYVKKALICKNTGNALYIKIFANICKGFDHETQCKQYQIGESLFDPSLSHHEIQMLRYIKKYYHISYASTPKTLMRIVISQNWQVSHESVFFQRFRRLPIELQYRILEFL